MNNSPVIHIPRLALTPVELAASVGVGRTRIFKAIKDGELRARKAGTKTTIIDIEAAQEWVKSLPYAPAGQMEDDSEE